jgi:uncharacterized protein (TIGR00730 family)
MLRRICVFCGASSGNRPAYVTAAKRVGRELAERGIGLVYGGGNVGLMGTVADACLEAGGYVIGVIPQALVAKEVAHKRLSDLRIVASMHERKAMMAELSDAFVAMPGGFGTFEECFEVVTWAQLGLHVKPCALLNVEGYYDPLIALIDHAVKEGFISSTHQQLLLSGNDTHQLLDKLVKWRPMRVEKYISRAET